METGSHRTAPTTTQSGSIPETWVTLFPEGTIKWFLSYGLMIKISQVILHEADQPDFVLGLFDADFLPGKDGAEVDFAAVGANSVAGGERYGFVVEWVLLIRQPLILS